MLAGCRGLTNFVLAGSLLVMRNKFMSHHIAPRTWEGGLATLWPWVMWCVLGLLVSIAYLVSWVSLNSIRYVQPNRHELTVSNGALTFTTWWKSSGGDAQIATASGQLIVLTCAGPYGDSPCFRKKIDGKWQDFESSLVGKNATAWWMPERPGENSGRLYQLLVGNRIFLSYEDQAKKYQSEYMVGPLLTRLVASFLVFVLVVPFSAYKIVKGIRSSAKLND